MIPCCSDGNPFQACHHLKQGHRSGGKHVCPKVSTTQGTCACTGLVGCPTAYECVFQTVLSQTYVLRSGHLDETREKNKQQKRSLHPSSSSLSVAFADFHLIGPTQQMVAVNTVLDKFIENAPVLGPQVPSNHPLNF